MKQVNPNYRALGCWCILNDAAPHTPHPQLRGHDILLYGEIIGHLPCRECHIESSWLEYRLVVRMSRCGRDNPASTSGEDAVSTGDSTRAPGPPKGALSASMLAFAMDHLPSMRDGQSISDLVVECIIAIDVTRV